MNEDLNRALEELNKDWKKYVTDNRLVILMNASDEAVQFLNNLTFGKPYLLNDRLETKDEGKVLLHGWEIACLYTGERSLTLPPSFQLGLFEMYDGGVYISDWMINSGWDSHAHLMNGYPIDDYFQELGIDSRGNKMINQAFSKFGLQHKIRNMVRNPAKNGNGEYENGQQEKQSGH